MDFPPNISQKQADTWAREHQFNHLPFKLNKLKKMIEYSNVALNSSMHPKVITFIVEAEEIVNNLEFILTAYKGNGNFIEVSIYLELKKWNKYIEKCRLLILKCKN